MSGLRDPYENNGANPFFFPREDEPDVHGRIMLIAILTLSAVVVFVAMLHVYTRYMLRRQARRQTALQGIRLIARIHSEEPLRRGLEPMVIASLPIVVYKDNKDNDHDDKDRDKDHSGVNNECAVCISAFEDGQMIRVLPNCKHHFHAECIDKWLGSHITCPVCRQEVELSPTITPLPREPSTRLRLVDGVQGGVGPPLAPPLEQRVNSVVGKEGTSDDMVQSSFKVNGTNSRLDSFRMMLSMDLSSRRANSFTRDGNEDLERQ